MATRRFNPPDLTNALEERVGPYKLALVYRRIANDEGPTIHVFGPAEGEDREILRFDCFRNEPHYHPGISYLDVPVQTIESHEPLNWVLIELQERFPDYLTQSQTESQLPDDWQSLTERAVEAFKAKAGEWGTSA